MATGLAANIEIFADGQVIFSHNSDLQECGPDVTSEDIVNKLKEGGVMGQLDKLRGEGAELVYQFSLYTSEGTLLVDGLAGDEIPADNSGFEERIKSEISGLHDSLVKDGYIVNNCKEASGADAEGTRVAAVNEGSAPVVGAAIRP
ncbi:MAG: hypothetical protein KDI90_08565 [Alphaproteobacteria bacterium]|nr:hypothetical protein [Alphaproteobacteria bacterium]